MNYNKKTILDVDVKGKKVLLRCDFNVPQDKETGAITSDKRIVAALPTIRYLLDNGAAVIACSHLGKPKGEWKTKLSLAPVAKRLSELLGQEVIFASDVVGEDAQAKAKALQGGQIMLLENLRFHIEEEKNDPAFAKKLADMAELYVSDAFGSVHRAHASTVGVAAYLPAVSGLLVAKELEIMSDQEGYETFVVPDDVGGRYSVLTAVGLLPIAVAGVDIEQLMAGAETMMEICAKDDMSANAAWQYAATRHQLYHMGKKIEILAAFEPSFRFMAEWWKQLFGESEGKENKGLFPASADFTADLHSMGQYIQQGERHLFETVVRFGESLHQNEVPFDKEDRDGLNFLGGKSMDFINTQAMDGVLLAHEEGGVPNIVLQLGQLGPFTLGEMIYFFEYACGLSGYLMDVNPFDQPGVEAYKKNMFALLNKPGYEEKRAELLEKLGR